MNIQHSTFNIRLFGRPGSITTALVVNGIALAVVALAFILKGTDLDAGLA